MGIRKQQHDKRTQVRLSGHESLKDVAVKLFKDVRLLPLLVDLNPSLSSMKAAAAGTVVTVPSKAEAQRFAARMGFSLGFNPALGGGTQQKRAWSRMKKGQAKASSAVCPHELARLFFKQQLVPEVAARRARVLLSEEAVQSFVAAEHDDDAAQFLAKALQGDGVRHTVAQWLGRLLTVFSSTSTPKARRALVDACAHAPEGVRAVLSASLVVPKLQDDLVELVTPLSPLLQEAEALASVDELQRQAQLKEHPLAEALLMLAGAAEADLPLLAQERLERLGVGRQFAALDKHCQQLATTLKRTLERLDRVDVGVLQSVVDGGDVESLPRPWPVLAKVTQALAPAVMQQHPGALERGLQALLPSSPTPTGPQFQAGELAARAAHNAKVADDFDAVPHRLAPTVVALLTTLRPLPPDHGPEAQVRQRRKVHFDKTCLAPKGADVDVDVVTAVLEELARVPAPPLERDVAHALASQKAVLKRLAAAAVQPIPVLVKSASNLGRALVLAAIAADAEWGRALATPQGIEQALRVLNQHATRTLTLATQQFVQAPLRAA